MIVNKREGYIQWRMTKDGKIYKMMGGWPTPNGDEMFIYNAGEGARPPLPGAGRGVVRSGNPRDETAGRIASHRSG